MQQLNVLSLFDGYSGLQLALKRAGISVNKYFAAEIDKYCRAVTMQNFPRTINLGDVRVVNGEYFKKNGIQIDLLAGGSPCQGFSIAGKRLNFDDPRSKLFFEYVRILKELRPRYFLLENVASMSKCVAARRSELLEVEPIKICSSLVSAQKRCRLYWSNIPGLTQPVDRFIDIDDILETPGQAYTKKNGQFKKLKSKVGCLLAVYGQKQSIGNLGKRSGFTVVKSTCLTANYSKGSDNHGARTVIMSNDDFRLLTPIECERLQTLPDNYTEWGYGLKISNSQRYKMLGNGFTVDVISHILSHLNEVRIQMVA